MNTTQKEKESHKRLQGRCQRERKQNAFTRDYRRHPVFGMHSCKELERNKHNRGSGRSDRNQVIWRGQEITEIQQKESKRQRHARQLPSGSNLGLTCKESQSFQQQRRRAWTRCLASNCAFCGYHRVQPRSSWSSSNKTPLKPKHTGTSGEKVPKNCNGSESE